MQRNHDDRPPIYDLSVRALAAELVGIFDLRECRYEPFPFDAQLPRVEPGRIVLPAAEPGVIPWQLDRAVELPVCAEGLTLGRFVLVPRSPTCGVSLSPRGRTIAITLAERLAPLIAGAILADERASERA